MSTGHLFAQLEGRRRILAAILAAGALLALLLALHAAVGFNHALRTLYVLPVWLATRLGGRWAGVSLVVLAAATGTLADLSQHPVERSSATATGLFWLLSLGVVMLVIARVEEALWNWRKEAMRDSLTGLLNRRAMRDFAGDAVSRANLLREPLVVVLIDCDDFKKLNDNFGHSAGDHVLQILARVLERETRESDLLARTGGDEFVVILPGSTHAEARAVMERVEKVFEERVKDAGYTATVSIGLSHMSEEDVTIDNLLRNADREMYARKMRKRSGAFLN